MTKLILAALTAFMAVTGTSTALGNDTISGVPRRILIDANGLSFNFNTGAADTCTGGTPWNKYVHVPASSPFLKEILALLLYSKNTGNAVGCSVASQTSNCTVVYCELQP